MNIATNETGQFVCFAIPFAAIFYGESCVRLSAQDKVDDTMDELIELHYSVNEN